MRHDYIYIFFYMHFSQVTQDQNLSSSICVFFFTQRAISPVRPHKFVHLRHLRLELNIFGVNEDRKTDVLDYAYLLDCAPSLEILELHVNSNSESIHSSLSLIFEIL